MNRAHTSLDMQRIAFVESLYSSLNKQAAEALQENQRFVKVANSYLQDGLDEAECVELLMIDGLSREAAESYVSMASAKEEVIEEGLDEYSFTMEDDYGKIWSSFDIRKTVKASDAEEAKEKAEEIIGSDARYASCHIVSVSKMS